MSDDELLKEELETPVSRVKLNCAELLEKKETSFEIISDDKNGADAVGNILNECQSSTASYGNELNRMYDLLTRNSPVIDDKSKNFVYEMRSDFAKYKLQMIDVSPPKNGAIMKKVLRDGVGEILPTSSLKIAKFNYSLFVENQDEPFDSTRLRNRVKKAKVDDGGLIVGLNIAVRTMKRGEVSDFIIAPEYAYKKQGCPPRVPPDCVILAEVELVEWVDVDEDDPIDTMTNEEREKLSSDEVKRYVEKKLNVAKSLYSKMKINAACNRYNEARSLLETLPPFNIKQNEISELKHLRYRLYTNLVLCYIKLDMLQKASTYLEIVEPMYSNDLKILYLRTKILFKQISANYVEALATAREAQNIAPTNTDLMQLINEIDAAKSKYELKSKDQARRMLSIGKK